ncbi:MAG: cytochrome c oxidase assembly protein [Proteobacteria bacterium]|nr:MAG: cytochrome c oxidase assembly protein [Pseudomonadota bacterium]
MTESENVERRNRRTTLWLGAIVVGMFGFGYAMIPLYNVFCEITGINGKGIQISTAGDLGDRIDRERTVTVEFTGSVMGGLPWEMEPAEKVEVHPGETVRITYSARNLAGREVVGQAVPSVSPPRATRHFIKTECFCFTNQALAAGEHRDMPLIFRVDPELPRTVKTITLSYAFYRAEKLADAAKATDRPG